MGLVFPALHLKAAHVKSSTFTHTPDEVGNQSVVKSTSAGKQRKKRTPGILRSFAHDKTPRERFRKRSKPTGSCCPQQNSRKARFVKDIQAFCFSRSSSHR